MPSTRLVKRNWEEDIIYHIQFPRSGCIPQISPFALKLETWLRATKLNYHNISNNFTIFSHKGQIPFAELNGRQIADSNAIIEHLKEKFTCDIDNNLSEEQKAIGRAIRVLAEESLFRVLIFNRSKHIEWIVGSEGFGDVVSGLKKKFFEKFGLRMFKRKLENKCQANGIGKNKEHEVEEMLKGDLKALSVLLGDKPYFFGDSFTTTDATVFGQLAQFYYTPILNKQAIVKFMDEETPNLVEFIKRIKETYWSDWDELTKTKKQNLSDPDVVVKPKKEKKTKKEKSKKEDKKVLVEDTDGGKEETKDEESKTDETKEHEKKESETEEKKEGNEETEAQTSTEEVKKDDEKVEDNKKEEITSN
ncbi:Failed axon connections homolog [Strongyloides ratti]|uniref:Failed axon connections homolog n=1 Tax=Strongyloides ratti TaxID=34506 RepID=A0A090L9N8_STRRB|nr:Failed axon connections homolog [Strongyloides ratti]CEF66506.1 Failed axon connections homolog [Strongyloides ratti]